MKIIYLRGSTYFRLVPDFNGSYLLLEFRNRIEVVLAESTPLIDVFGFRVDQLEQVFSLLDVLWGVNRIHHKFS